VRPNAHLRLFALAGEAKLEEMLRFGTTLALALAACVASCKPDEVVTPTYESGLFPKVAHSGFNSTASFKVMFATNERNPRWTVADPSIATIAPSQAPVIPGLDTKDLSFALVTTTKAGETNVTATSGGTTLTAHLSVRDYTTEQLAVGKARYETPSDDPARKPCASCHAKEGGVDHSPLKMAGFDDATILGVIQQATYPPTPTGQSTTSLYAPKGPLKFTDHKWNLTDPEKDGILAHLRSLRLTGL
jgi:hypothetical protein